MEFLWNQLLELRKEVKEKQFFCYKYISANHRGQILLSETSRSENELMLTDQENIKEGASALLWRNDRLELIGDCPFSAEVLEFLLLYLPFCLQPLTARKKNRSLCTVHLAQTLDGKIATQNGSSKWIGNEENLRHAHRMRAMHAAVVVGRKTFSIDHPQLTVRMVSGVNPERVVIWGSDQSDPPDGFRAIVCEINGRDENSNFIEIKDQDGIIPTIAILEKLYQLGIDSIYLEGGSFSVSQFLQSGLIDNLQIHFSTKILGSGLSGFQLDPVDHIHESISLNNPTYFRIGEEMMITGHVN